MKIKARCNNNSLNDHGLGVQRGVGMVGAERSTQKPYDPSIVNLSFSFTAQGDRSGEVDFDYGDEVEISIMVLRTAAEVKVAEQKAATAAAEAIAAEQQAASQPGALV